MKKLFCFLMVCTIVCSKSISQICAGTQVTVTQNGQCDNNPYVLVFEDNFDGITPDLSKWVLPYQGVLRDFNHAKEKQWYANTGNSPSISVSNNVLVNNGLLTLTARKEINPITGTYVSNYNTNPWTYSTENFEYSSGEIDSRYKFGYGKFEIKCRIPKGRGFWPAFWMYGLANNVNNEIDVFEFWDDNPNDHHMTVHYNGQQCSGDYNGPDYSLAFHIFTVVWDIYKIEWYVDGNLKRRATRFWTLTPAQVDCNNVIAYHSYLRDDVFPQDPMNIIANLAIQNGYFGPNLNTPFPSSLEIEYIRYYKKLACSGPVNYTNVSQLNLSNAVFNVAIGTTITVGGNFVLQSQQLDLIARDKIVLSPGFQMAPLNENANFSARIDPSICAGKRDIEQEPLERPMTNIVQIDTSNPTTISTNDERRPKIVAYPNPNRGTLFLKIEGTSESYQLVLIDVTGRAVSSMKTLGRSKIELNLSLHGYGSYLLTLLNQKGESVFSDRIIYH